VTRIALATDGNDWHARALGAAFAALGADVVRLRLEACRFATTRAHGLDLPGFADALPDAVLVRTMAGGSFEEVTRRLGVLHALAALGVPVWNEARAIERCVDKSMTSFLLSAAGLPTPPTWTVEGLAAARDLVTREAATGALVLKPLFGSQGRGLRLVAGPEDLPAADAVHGVYYLQRYVSGAGPGFFDHRLLICDGALVSAMTRRAAGWITNVRRGGQPEPFAPDDAMVRLAVAAADCVGARYAGVDVLCDAAGQALVLEINSMPAWQGLQRVTATNIARRLAEAVLASLR
jgi:tetrahydromethanopterin:alpha-L-glutamate ligase